MAAVAVVGMERPARISIEARRGAPRRNQSRGSRGYSERDPPPLCQVGLPEGGAGEEVFVGRVWIFVDFNFGGNLLSPAHHRTVSSFFGIILSNNSIALSIARMMTSTARVATAIPRASSPSSSTSSSPSFFPRMIAILAKAVIVTIMIEFAVGGVGAQVGAAAASFVIPMTNNPTTSAARSKKNCHDPTPRHGSQKEYHRRDWSGNNNHRHAITSSSLFAFPQISWPSFPSKENNNDANGNKNSDIYYYNALDEFGGLNNNNNNNNNLTYEAESTMHRAVKMMEEHRRSQEAAERTSAIMEELASITVVGRSRAGSASSFAGVVGGISNVMLGGFGGGGADDDTKNRGGGVKVTFNGQQRPVSVNVDSKFLSSLMMLVNVPAAASSSSSSSATTTTTTTPTTTTTTTSMLSASEELNKAIIDAMQDGYEKSGKIMEEKLKGLYEQLGLPKRE